MTGIDNLITLEQAKSIASLFSKKEEQDRGLINMIGKKVIIRTCYAGVWFGELSEKYNEEVILKNARRMWSWHAKESISLSACAKYGINVEKSKIVSPVSEVWLQAIEIIPCTNEAIKSLEKAPYVKAE